MAVGNTKNVLDSTGVRLLFKIWFTLQTCHCQPLPCVWRITLPPSDAQAGHVGVYKPFQVSYLDWSCAQGLQWDVSSGCIVHNDSLAETLIHCTHASHQATIVPTLQQSCSHCVPYGRSVSVRRSPLCYRWFIQHLDKTGVGTVNDTGFGEWRPGTLRVWVVDWTSAGDEERNWTARAPSQSSAALTRLFHGKGQRPQVKQVHPTNRQELRAVNATFLWDLSCWELMVKMPGQSEMAVKVTGRPEVAAGNCFIGDTTELLLADHWLSSSSTIGEESPQQLQLRYSSVLPPRLVQDPCASCAAISLSQSSVLFTDDCFRTAQNLSLPSFRPQDTGPDGAGLGIEGAVFITHSHLLLLLESRVYALHRSMAGLAQVTGLSGQSFIKGRDWCLNQWSSHWGHLAVSFNTSSVFLISGDSANNLTAEEVVLPHTVFQGLGFTAELTLVIQDVAFHGLSDRLAFAVVARGDSSSALAFLLYDVRLAVWSRLPFWLAAGEMHGRVSLMFTETAQNASLIFWDQTRLYYTHHHGGRYGAFSLMDSGETMLNVSDNEAIRQVSVSPAGDVVVLMTSNRLYYSRIGLDTLLRLPAADLPTSSTLALFNRLSRLLIRSDEALVSTGGSQVWHYPLALEVRGALWNSTAVSCPYKHFGHTDICSLYFLDIGEEVRLWSSLTFPSDGGLRLQVIASSSHLLDIQKTDAWDYYPGWLALNKTLTVQASFNRLDPAAGFSPEDIPRFTGDASVEMKPSLDDIGCRDRAAMVTHFSIGCPPGRHIRVRAPDHCKQISNYTIPRDAYRLINGSDPQTDKVVQYDWSTYGCPILSHYQQSFRPTIDLYDNDEFVTELSKNYVLSEEQRRTDFSYNATMWQAGCRTVTLPTSPSGSNEDIALSSSQSHQSCFALNTNGTSSADLRRRHYKVLNSTGVAWVVWSARRNNSIYQFTATVVDPGFSFCHLQAMFAVRVYGHLAEVSKKPVTPVTLATFALLTFALGAISYVYFREGHVKRLAQQLVDYDND